MEGIVASGTVATSTSATSFSFQEKIRSPLLRAPFFAVRRSVRVCIIIDLLVPVRFRGPDRPGLSAPRSVSIRVGSYFFLFHFISIFCILVQSSGLKAL
jgi:hypothetical protein